MYKIATRPDLYLTWLAMTFSILPLSTYQQIQQVKDHYNIISSHFNQTRSKPLWTEILPFIAQVKSGMKVLDVGCGNGRLLSELGNKKIKYLGIDFSNELIKKARQHYPTRRFLTRDITLEDDWRHIGDYDALFSLGVLHHIPDRNRQHLVLQQMYEHTLPGGFIVLSVWNMWQWRFLKTHLSQLSKKMEYGNLSYIWVPYSISDGNRIVRTINRFIKAYFPGELLNLVKQVGFKIDTFYYASKGQTRLSILNGQNFCLLARKPI